MAAGKLREPLIEGGIRHVHFFNGRLLTAEDLGDEQKADAQHRAHLGQGLGDGVIWGLEVAPHANRRLVTVEPGAAINRLGKDLRLGAKVNLDIAQRFSATADAGCAPANPIFRGQAESGGEAFTGTGPYVLVMGPAREFLQRAPMARPDNCGELEGCGSRYCVEGAVFRLVRIDVSRVSGDPVRQALQDAPTGDDAQSRHRLRNLWAHACLGLHEARDWAADFAGAHQAGEFPHGAVDRLREAGLVDDSEVPLALVFWGTGGVRFVDRWAVRRPLSRTQEKGMGGGSPTRLAGETLAAQLQFQEQLRDLLLELPHAGNLKARDYFRLVPPLGMTPLESTRHPLGVVGETFFQGLAIEPPKSLAWARLRRLLMDGLDFAPVDLGDRDARGASRSFLQLYEVDANQEAQGPGTAAPQEYWLFAAWDVPYLSDEPRFGRLCRTVRETREAYHSLIESGGLAVSQTPETGEILGKKASAKADAAGREAHIASLNKLSKAGLATVNSLLNTRTLLLHLLLNPLIQDVVNQAGERITAACCCAQSLKEALGVLKDLYLAQDRLARALAQFGGVFKDQKIAGFARQLSLYLHEPGQDYQALEEALEEEALASALDTQDLINGFILDWTHRSAQGNLDVTYDSADEGDTLVLRDSNPRHFRYTVANRTDKELDISLEAHFRDHPEWDAFLRVTDANGNTLSSVRLKAQGGVPDEAEVIVEADTPATAEDGDSDAILLLAKVPPPVGMAAQDLVPVKIGDEETPEAEHSIRLQPGSPQVSGRPDRVQVGDEFSITNIIRYANRSSVPQGRFQVRLTSTQGELSRYVISFSVDGSPLQTLSPSASVRASAAFPLTRDQNATVVVSVVPVSGGTLAFGLDIVPEDAALGLSVDEGFKVPFTVVTP